MENQAAECAPDAIHESQCTEDEQAERLRVWPADIVCALNFSLCLMHSRASGLQYLRCSPDLMSGKGLAPARVMKHQFFSARVPACKDSHTDSKESERLNE